MVTFSVHTKAVRSQSPRCKVSVEGADPEAWGAGLVGSGVGPGTFHSGLSDLAPPLMFLT